MASLNAACAAGLSEKFGRIDDGYVADIVVWIRSTLEIKRVFVRGRGGFATDIGVRRAEHFQV